MARSLTAIAVCVGVAGLSGFGTTPTRAQPPLPQLRLNVETPLDGAVVGGADPSVFIAGRAQYGEREAVLFDLVIVLDRSKSTNAPSGSDIDGDGYVGRPSDRRFSDGSSDDRGDQVFAAEIAAARALLDQLDPRTTRVGIVEFAGDSDRQTPDALTRFALSHDYEAAQRALDELGELQPSGATNLAAALNLATAELIGTPSAKSEIRPGAVRVALVLSDGNPTLPVPFAPEINAEKALEAAQRAARAGVRVDFFAIGNDEEIDITVPMEIARITQGRFTSVTSPSDLVSTFEALRLVDVEELVARNLTTGAKTDAVWIEPDGRFATLIPLADGENRIELMARTSDGQRVRRWLRVMRSATGEVAVLEPRWLALRTRVLEQSLRSAVRKGLEIEVMGASQPGVPASAEEGSDSRDSSRRSIDIVVGDDAKSGPAQRP